MLLSLFKNREYSREEVKGLLEAILFLKGKSVSFDELKKILSIGQKDLEELVNELNKEYNENKRGFNIIFVASGVQLVTNPHYFEELSELFGKRNEYKISKSALETLAIIAYKQPITKEEIDSIRGVSSTKSINNLLEMKLITISGTDKEIKSPLYCTTERFLEIFKIKSLDDLPPINSIDFDTFSETLEEEDIVDLEDQENATTLF